MNKPQQQQKLKTTKSRSKSSQRYKMLGKQELNRVRNLRRHVLQNMKHAKKRHCGIDYEAHVDFLRIVGDKKYAAIMQSMTSFR